MSLHGRSYKGTLMHVKSLQSCPTVWDSFCNLLGSSVHRILQTRILDWVVILSFRVSSQPRDWTYVSYVFCLGRLVLYHQCHLGNPRELSEGLFYKDFPGSSDGKVSVCNAGDPGLIPGSGRSSGEGKASLAWKIPWTEDPSRLQSMGSQRVRHDWETSLHFIKVLPNPIMSVPPSWPNHLSMAPPPNHSN